MKTSDVVLIAAGGVLLLGAGMSAQKVSQALLETMARAIQNFEGWYPGSRSYRNNNPGNLKLAGQAGATGADETGHAIFDSFASGWAALLSQLRIAFEGRSRVYTPADTLYTFFGKYAEANSISYARSVAAALGVAPGDTLAAIMEGYPA